MTASAGSPAGQTRTCPHCKSTILKSAAVCPACHHFLRLEAVKAGLRPLQTLQPLRIEGTVRQPTPGNPCEYSVIVAVYNERREEISRRVVAVGSLDSAQTRTFTVWVEVYTPAPSD